MELLKWSMILLYWLWLANRNVHTRQKDWRLVIQILINAAVILLIIMEDREHFVQLVSQVSSFIGMAYSKVVSFFPR